MAQTKPVDLCTHLLPTGKLCRVVALRDQRFCRSHIQNHRLLERERQHDQAMLRLRADLDSMDLPELLQSLETRLHRITSIVRTYPEARQPLALTINRLHTINAEFQQLSSAEINQMDASPIPSNT